MVYSDGDNRAMMFMPTGKRVFLQPPNTKAARNCKYNKAGKQNKNSRKQTLNFPQNQAIQSYEPLMSFKNPQGFSNAIVYEPPRLKDLRCQNRLQTRRFFGRERMRAPRAPRNTSSFIMRAKKEGGIASLVSPIPATPALLPTPAKSPAPTYKEGLVDQVNREWGIDGYGSMNGLIRLRQHRRFLPNYSSECDSDMENQQVEKRVDQDVSRFEMIHPSDGVHRAPSSRLAETVSNDRENHISHLEEENLTLKERLFVMEQELEELRRRLQLKESEGVSEDEAEVCSDQSVGDVSCAQN